MAVQEDRGPAGAESEADDVQEKERLRLRLVELYPSWKRYRTWTDRDFRLFALVVQD